MEFTSVNALLSHSHMFSFQQKITFKTAGWIYEYQLQINFLACHIKVADSITTSKLGNNDYTHSESAVRPSPLFTRKHVVIRQHTARYNFSLINAILKLSAVVQGKAVTSKYEAYYELVSRLVSIFFFLSFTLFRFGFCVCCGGTFLYTPPRYSMMVEFLTVYKPYRHRPMYFIELLCGYSRYVLI